MQSHLGRIQSCSLPVCDQCILLAHQSRIHRAEDDPVLHVFRFDGEQAADCRLRFGEPATVEQRLGEAAPDQRQVRRLPLRVAQQAFRILGDAGRQRYRSKSAQRADMTRIRLEDVTEDLLGALAILLRKQSASLFDTP